MKQEVIDALEKKFEKFDIYSRQQGGRKLDYVQGFKVLQRLNKAFKGDWSFEVLTSPKDAFVEGFCIVHGRLSVWDPESKTMIVRDGTGGKKCIKAKVDGQYIDLAADYKASCTDVLKKAASTFGVGLDLYGGDSDDEDEKKVTTFPLTQSAENQEQIVDGPAKQNQISAIKAMVTGKKLKIDEVLAKYKVKTPEELKESQAKEVIVNLNKVV